MCTDLVQMDCITPFEDLRVTTTVLIFYLEGNINLNTVFFLLPTTKIELPQQRRQTKKFKLPECNIPGALLSLRYKKFVRGIVRSAASKTFNHSITIDIATSVKAVSVKLAPETIHMCGATSFEMGWEGAGHIVNHVTRIQKNIDFIKENSEKSQKTLEWVRKVTKGKMVVRDTIEPFETSKISFNLHKYSMDYCINTGGLEFPDDIDKDFAIFLMQQAEEFIYYTDFSSKLDWVMTVDYVCSKDLKITRLKNAMVNYNYNI